ARTRPARRPWPSTRRGRSAGAPSEPTRASEGDDAMLYRGMDRAALDAAYNNTEAVGIARRERYVAGWSARSDAGRRARGGGPAPPWGAAPRQPLAFSPCGRRGAPTLAYAHGGYWQMNDKEPYAFFGEPLGPAGFPPAVIEYTLAPAARLDQIVAE